MSSKGKRLQLMALAGTVDTEVRLGVALSEFREALDKKYRSRLQELEKAATVDRDVIRLTEEINREGADLHRRSWRPLATRLHLFLARIQAFVQIGDVFVGGSQNLLVAGVWTAVRMSLEVSIRVMAYFDKISELFMHLATSWGLHKDFAALFPQHKELQALLCNYFIMLVELCTRIVQFSGKSFASHLSFSIFSSFEAEFGPLEARLAAQGRSIEQTANLLATASALQETKKAVKRHANLKTLIKREFQQDRSQQQRQRIFDFLCPKQSRYSSNWRRERRKGDCHWIFNTPRYRSWIDGEPSSVLWLSGNLGSGKTVALANIVADVRLQHPCAFFFCTSADEATMRSREIIGSLVRQMVSSIPADDPFWKNDDIRDETKIGGLAPEELADRVLDALPDDRRYFVVIDGLEYCAESDMKDVLQTLQRSLSTNKRLSLCLSSRTDSMLHRAVTRHLQITHRVDLNDIKRCEEIEAFIVSEVERRRGSRQLDPEVEALVKKQLISGARGMYLWVVLQLEAILPVYPQSLSSEANILNIIMNLPENLSDTYDAALARIQDSSTASKMFQLLAAARRPLATDELMVALAVVPEDLRWQECKIQTDPGLFVSIHGGSLLEIDEQDGEVRFIHHSALLHLLRERSAARGASSTSYCFDLDEADVRMGEVCVTYLNYGIFDTRISVKTMVQASEIPAKVIGSVAGAGKLAALSRIFTNPKRVPAESLVNIARVAQDLQAKRFQRDDEKLRSLFRYASSYWLQHTRSFDMDMTETGKLWSFWLRLVDGEVTSVPLPPGWDSADPATVIEWALDNRHRALFQHAYFNAELAPESTAHIRQSESAARTETNRAWLEDTIAQLLCRERWGLEQLELLIGIGADPAWPHRRNGQAPLALALWHMPRQEGESVVRNLLVEDERVRAVLRHPSMPQTLSRLIMLKCDDILRLVLDHNPLVESPVQEGLLPLHATFLRFGYDFDADVRLPPSEALLSLSLRSSRETFESSSSLVDYTYFEAGELVEKLVLLGANPIYPQSISSEVVRLILGSQDSFTVVRSMVSQRPELIKEKLFSGDTLLVKVLRYGKADIADIACLLLDLGADPDGSLGRRDGSVLALDNRDLGSVPLTLAMDSGMAATVESLLRHGCRTVFEAHEGGTSETATALIMACKRCTFLDLPMMETEAIIEAIGTHLQKQDDDWINYADKMGNTALHYATVSGGTMPSLLLQLGANANARNTEGTTPLYFAVRDRAFSTACGVARQLLDYGADPNVKTYAGESLWELMTERTSTSNGGVLLQPLIEAGLDVNMELRDDITSTPLHLLSQRHGCATLIPLLLKAGANTSAKNKRGQTPLALAVERLAEPEELFVLLNWAREHGPRLSRSDGLLQLAFAHPSITKKGVPPHRFHHVVGALLDAGADPYEEVEYKPGRLVSVLEVTVCYAEISRPPGDAGKVRRWLSVLLEFAGRDANQKANWYRDGDPDSCGLARLGANIARAYNLAYTVDDFEALITTKRPLGSSPSGGIPSSSTDARSG